ncbi:2TM domain-containing protein [uncultured Tenacibaculum sp.]|uniref:2TM domain-containing protein n=1 Tax=uncultured Tenacibaculum sp. TaxID=174713 RepID=UPI002606E2B4|nr:2TM domain-containing protein [uncultured Tenacibaculum sp.]
MELPKEEEIRYMRALKKVKEIKEFYSHLLIYIIVIPILIFINLKFSPQFHWFWFSVFGWGIGLFSHGFQIFDGFKLIMGKNWEERKINEYIKEYNRNGK